MLIIFCIYHDNDDDLHQSITSLKWLTVATPLLEISETQERDFRDSWMRDGAMTDSLT